MFLHPSVILFTMGGGVYLSMEWGKRCLPKETQRQPLKRAVRSLLECILVSLLSIPIYNIDQQNAKVGDHANIQALPFTFVPSTEVE